MKYKKKLIKVGNSIAVVLPADWVNSHVKDFGEKRVWIDWTDKNILEVSPCNDPDPVGVKACDED